MSFSIGMSKDGSFDGSFDATFRIQGPKGSKRMQYNFDNIDDVIRYNARYWNPDAPTFELQFDADLTPSGTIVAQNLSSTSSEREFQLYKVSTGLKLVIGGITTTLVSNAETLKGFAHWRIVYENGRVVTYKDGIKVGDVTATVGTARESGATFTIGARTGTGGNSYASYFSGVIRNVKMWYAGTSTTGRLLLNSPIDDGVGSNEINNLGGYGTGRPLNFNDNRWEAWSTIAVVQPSTQGFPYTFPMTF